MSLIQSETFKGLEGSKLHREISKFTPERLAQLEKFASFHDKIDSQVALSRNFTVVEKATAMYQEIRDKKKEKEDLKTEIFKFCYQKYVKYVTAGDEKNMYNVIRYVNNAQDEFELDSDEKASLKRAMPGYLKRFALYYEDETEDMSHVICCVCATDGDPIKWKTADKKIMDFTGCAIIQCEADGGDGNACGLWMCNKCAGNPTDWIPNGKKNADPLKEDHWGCGMHTTEIRFTDFCGDGLMFLRQYAVFIKRHAEQFAPPFDSAANQEKLKEIEEENLQYSIFQVHQRKFNDKRKKLRKNHRDNKKQKKYILDDSEDEKTLKITNGEIVHPKEQVPNNKIPGEWKLRDKWSMEQWHKHITTEAKKKNKKNQYMPNRVLGVHKLEGKKLIKDWSSMFNLEWHPDKNNHDLTNKQKRMVNEMLGIFNQAKKDLLTMIEENRHNLDSQAKSNDKKELKSQGVYSFKMDSDSDSDSDTHDSD